MPTPLPEVRPDRKKVLDTIFTALAIRAKALDAVADAVCISDETGTVLHVNPAFTTVTGHGRDEVVGVAVRELLLGEAEPALLACLRPEHASEPPWHGELWLNRKTGEPILVRLTCSPMRDGHVVLTFRDITAFRRSAEAVRRSASSFRRLIEGNPDGVAVHRNGCFIYVNLAFMSCLGRQDTSAVVGTPVLDVVHPDERAGAPAMLTATEPQPSLEWRLLRGDGSVLHADVSCMPVEFDGEPAFVLIARDLTSRRAMETRIREMDRMVSIGTLASGIAHEINTPIQYIGDSAHFLQSGIKDLMHLLAGYRELALEQEALHGPLAQLRDLAEEEERIDMPFLEDQIPKALGRALEGLGRVATIVRAMKEFGHPGTVEMVPADLNKALRNAIVVARNEWRYVAGVHAELGELPLVTCHLAALNQVFLNLLVNAAHAVSDVVGDSGEKGTIHVTSEAEGDEVHIRIQDSGGGIPDGIGARVFDPFFTTKDVGRGTGQGLAIARSIVVDKHGGRLSYTTTPGGGTTFHVWLPITPRR